MTFRIQGSPVTVSWRVANATSVSITVQTLIELGQLETKEGTTLLAAAVIDDVIAIIVQIGRAHV